MENKELINEILKIAYKAVPKKCALDGNKLIEVHNELTKFIKSYSDKQNAELKEDYRVLNEIHVETVDKLNGIESRMEVAIKALEIISKNSYNQTMVEEFSEQALQQLTNTK